MSNPLLQGVRILDLSRLLPGPFCTQYLAQMGAEVIKIEDPDGGDPTRQQFPELFRVINRGKQSVTLDLRREEDAAHFKELVKTADVVLESFRPGVMERLGCGYDTLKTINPRLVYAALTGYGQNGPFRDIAGHDLNYLAWAGVLDQIGTPNGPPTMANVQIADLAGGALTCVMGIQAALLGARASGEGAFVDSAMLDGSLALQPVALATLRSQGATRPRGKDVLSGALPNYNLYKCRDGKYLAVGALEPRFFIRLLKALGQQVPLPEVLKEKIGEPQPRKPQKKKESPSPQADGSRLTETLSDPAKARRLLAPLRWALASVFRLRKRDAWMAALAEADACLAPVLTLEEALENEQVRARGMIEYTGNEPVFASPLHFEGAEPQHLGESPELGASNEAFLTPPHPSENRTWKP